MITGTAALIIFVATIFYLIFPPCFVIWCFIEDWKWVKKTEKKVVEVKT